MISKHLKKAHLVCFCFALTCSLHNSAQSISKKQFAFKTLSINDGLSQNSVISIAQDSIGYLWLATQDGLNKYDGKTVTHYNKQFEDITRPTFSKLGKLYIDKQNNLWIITNSGKLELYHSKEDTFTHITSFANVSSVFQDKELNKYIGTYGDGLYKIDAKTKDTLQLLKRKTIYDFLETEQGLVVATSGSVYILDKDTSYKELSVNSATLSNFSTLEKSADGTFWLGTYGDGLYVKTLNSDSFVEFINPELPSKLNIEDLLIDDKNRLWIATYGNGVYLLDLDTQNINNFKASKNNPFAIHYNDILCLYEDTTKNVWIGTDGAGASYYDAHLIKFNVLTNNQVPKNVNVDVVRCITTDNQDNIWIGTSGKGLTSINLKTDTYKTYTTSNSALSSNRIISLCFNTDELWIGHQGFGLNIIDTNGHYQSYPEIKHLTIWKIVEENDDQSWLCTENNGIILFDKSEGIIKQYNTQNSALTSNNIRTLTKGNTHEIWIGSENKGLFKLNRHTDSITDIKTIDTKIKSLFYKDAILWVGTNGNGLKQYNTRTKAITTYTMKEGLPNNVIYGILPDNENNLWLSTNNGISKFNTINNKPLFENYNRDDGLQALEFNTGAYYKSQNGILYFGGLEGVNWFNPEQLTFNLTPPKTIISSFEVFSKKQPLIQNKAYRFNQNTVTFTFSSLHFSQPERNQYKYQLVNHDDNWIESGNYNSAHYTNLPPNDYTFKVISSNYDGVWNNTPATYNFTINQPWYFSTLALITYLLLFVLLTFSIYKYLKWRWYMKMQLQFEHKETQRLKQLDEFKTKLYTNISHEFRTPLTLISGPVENQLEKPNLSETDKKELRLVQNNSKRLLNLVNQLLDLSKLETGNLKLSVSKGNLTALLKQIVEAFQFKAKDKHINFNSNIEPLQNVWFDKDVIEKIISNLLSNAIKYTPERGKIHFDAKEKDGQIIMTVINNGNIISDKELSKLFQRYYQNNKNTEGVGIGLSLVKELTILSHGNIVAHTMNTDEIQFTVTLPIERSYYNLSEINEDTLVLDTLEHDVITTVSSSKSIDKIKEKPILLIVEDEKDIRQFIASIFEVTYIIKEASNGESGIKKAIKYVPDIIISDLMMPKIDGIELCNTLKHDEKTSHIPIIILTAKSGDANEIKGLETGADDYVVKPFNSKKLKIRVEKLIELRQKLQQRYSSTFELKDIANTPTDQQFLTKLKIVLNEHIINTSFSSSDLAKKMLMSRMQLHRKLKAIAGLSTTEFIRNERLKLATHLLKSSDLTVSEIAYQVGFNTPSYFIKCFKEIYKITPSEYNSK
ncbi:MAG: response regulator [Gelidibacter sp.]|nr:response regulator [Gelidibacter sp.]